MASSAEEALRQEIFHHLDRLVADTGVVTRSQLWDFTVDGEVHRLIDRNRGIRNPRYLEATLSILSDPDSSYADEQVDDSLFAYDYREGSVDGDNRKLRRAYELGLPLILLRKIADGVFHPVFPVWVVADDKQNRRFLIALDANLRAVADPEHLAPIERRYAERITAQRLHQPEFRARVLRAYEYRCAVCALGQPILLDAAHIIADGEAHSSATVDNGLALCKLHHAAYDANYLGIAPDYTIHVCKSLLEQTDGPPMLQHGLQDMHKRRITVPRKRSERPASDRLAERFDKFSSDSEAESQISGVG
ncbi:HNH endonuclease [Nocardia sp. CC201C]|uniref:HNH endonuclease n=1 Tax=Nocardia sp. CC201C TaxID=3044575 RepID=UPI0024A98691|nr:HNH endonuclease [Nocardia sp. CC201C]